MRPTTSRTVLAAAGAVLLVVAGAAHADGACQKLYAAGETIAIGPATSHTFAGPDGVFTTQDHA